MSVRSENPSTENTGKVTDSDFEVDTHQAATLADAGRDYLNRLRGGDMGSLPALLGLAVLFIVFNIAGGFFWITLFLLGGYFFGNIPIVQENFGLVVIGIIVVSVLPPIIEYLNHRRVAARTARAPEP